GMPLTSSGRIVASANPKPPPEARPAVAASAVRAGQTRNGVSFEHAMIPFENDNLKAYALLLRIEIAIRELLRISLEAEFGVQWRKRLPGELLKKIKESQS